MAEAKSLYVILSANASQYRAALRAASRATKDFGDDVDDNSTVVERGSLAINRYSGRLGILTKTLTTLTPAMSGFTAATVQGVGGLANMLSIATVGAGATVVAFQGLGGALEALHEAHLDPTAEKLGEAQAILDDLSPAAAGFALHLYDLLPALKDVRNEAADGLFPGLDRSLEDLEDLLPRAGELLNHYADIVGDLTAETAGSFNSDRWAEFDDFLEREARPTLTALTSVVGDLGHGLAELWMAFDPANDQFADGLVDMMDRFDKWASSLDESEGFQEFLDYLHETGPDVVSTLGSLVDALVQVGQASSVLTGPVLSTLEGFGDFLAMVADSDAGPALFTLIAAFSAARLATASWGALSTTTIGQTVSRSVASLGTLRTQIHAVRVDLSTLAAGWGTAGARSQREAERMSAAAGRVRAAFGGLRSVARGGALVGGAAFIGSGAADAMGAANTATYALTGAMIGGPYGAVAGGLVGAMVDVREAGKDYEDALDDIAAASRSASTGFADLQASSRAAFGELANRQQDLAGIDGVKDFVSDLAQYGIGGIPDLLSGGDLADEENAKNIQEQQRRWQNLTRVLQGVAKAHGDVVAAGDGGDAATLGFDVDGLSKWQNIGWLGDLEDMHRVATSIEPVMRELSLTWDDLFSATGDDRAQIIADINEQLAYMDSNAGKVDGVGEAIAGLDGALLSTADSTQAFSEAFSAAFDPNLNLSEQTDRWAEAMANLDKEVSGTTSKLFGQNEAIRENRSAIRERIDQIKDVLSAEAEAGASSEEVARSLRRHKQELIKFGIQAGLGETQLRKFVRQMGLTPSLVKTTFEAAGINPASRKVKQLRQQYDNLPKRVRTRIAADGVPKTKADVQAIVEDLDLTDKQRQILLNLQDRGAKQGITEINKLLKRVDEQDPTPKVDVDISAGQKAINQIEADLNNIEDENVYVNVRRRSIDGPSGGTNTPGGAGTHPGRGGAAANGALIQYADGGYGVDGRYYPRSSRIVDGGANILWGEQETGWEAYISGKPSQRHRNRGIWMEAGRRLGYDTDRRGSEHVTAVQNRTVVVRDRAPSGHMVLEVDGHRFNAYVRSQAGDVATRVARNEIDADAVWRDEQGLD